MIAHVRQMIWSLRVLWRLEGIVWPVDRLRLWRKSINLFLSYLAFTDSVRPVDQLHRAMICALLTAVYDYDSDWPQGKRDGSNFLSLLERYVDSTEAKTLGSRLFASDVGHELPRDGLKRGSIALHFCWLVIDSEWMRGYSTEEILSFGRLLQIIDDLFDLDGDYLSGDTNCLLLPDEAQGFADEARAFLDSDFFGRLKKNSRVYRTLEKMSRKTLNRFGGPRVTWAQLFTTGRPVTAGLYGLVLPVASFGFFSGAPWGLRGATALGFAGLTMSIMSFNDWVDREHDRKKGKLFASQHSQELYAYWKRLNVATTGALLIVASYDVWLAVFCVAVWLIGLFYSYVPNWYIVQNLIVAICGGAPALCGAVWARELKSESLWTFTLFAALLFMSEVYKDIEDVRIDTGYKETLPVRNGHVATVVTLFALAFVPATIACLHPHPWVGRVVAVGLPLVMFGQALMLIRREKVTRVKWAMKWLVTVLLLVLLFP